MALWTPAEITTALWLDADDSGTLTLDGSDNVEQWDDKSGNGRDFTQSTEAERPSIGSAAINGKDVVRFGGGNDVLEKASFPDSESAYSIFIVLQVDNDPPADVDQSGIWVFGEGQPCHHPYTNGELYNDFGSSSRRGPFSPGVDLDSPHLFSIESESGSWIARMFGDSIHSDDSNTVGMRSTAELGGATAPGRYLDGDIAEVVLLFEVPSESDRQKIEGYLAHKWGLEANLPAGHPYKSSPPYVFTCSGYTSVNGTRASGIPVRLYRRDTGALIGETTSAGVSGTFSIESDYNDYHYAVAIHPTSSGTNALIYDYLKPGE